MAASYSSLIFLIWVLSVLFFLSPICHSCNDQPNPDSFQADFCVADLTSKMPIIHGYYPCKPAAAVTADDFFFSGLAMERNSTTSSPYGATVTMASVATFPGLNTLGLSMNRVDFAPGGMSMPHTHPHASVMVMVLAGKLLVGFLSSGNVLYSKVVKPGEVFVIPMGMLHFMENVGMGKARAVTIFNSLNGGAVLLSPALFSSKPAIPSEVLARAFRVDEKMVNDIKSNFAA